MNRLAPLAAVLVLALAGASAGGAADEGCIEVSAAEGPAPLTVTLTAACTGTAFHWALGDGQTADGDTVTHTYAAGTFELTLTRTQADGTLATDQARVSADGIGLSTPRGVRFGEPATFRGTVRAQGAGATAVLAAGSNVVGRAPVGADGTFAITTKVYGPGPFRVKSGALFSNPAAPVVKPRVTLHVVGTPALGGRVSVKAQVAPARAGSLVLTVRRGTLIVATASGTGAAHLTLAPGSPGSYRITARVTPVAGWAPATALQTLAIVQPTLQLGSTGPAVRALEERLAAMRYALSTVDATFGEDTYDAVVAFQKVHNLARTGIVTATDWAVLLRSGVPHVQLAGDGIEVDKTRQVLFVVRHGEAQLIIPVSTGATGNTPIGTFHVYRKVPGWDWVLYYPNYFLRGFAIHGYVDVPTYPASHGCVRIPIWVSQRIYGYIAYGSRIVIHY